MATVALSGIITPSNVVTATSTTTLTNKTIAYGSNTLTDVVGVTATQTLTNKTLTAPTIASANLTTALTLAGAAGTNGQVLTSAGSGLPTWAAAGGGFSQAQIFSSSGSFTVPASGKFKVTIIGGGGSGTCSSSAVSGTGSGGGGGAVIKWYSGATPSATATVTIGSGGAGVSTANTAGNNGGSSTFALSGFTTLTAGGGTGGLTYGAQESSPGGTASGGDINSPGGWGSNAIDAGGSANQVGFAGSTLLAFGRAEMYNYNSAGIAGVYGTGSNGRYNSNPTGAGGAGICIVEY